MRNSPGEHFECSDHNFVQRSSCKLGNIEDPLGDPESIDDIIDKGKKKAKNVTTPAITRSRKPNCHTRPNLESNLFGFLQDLQVGPRSGIIF